MPISSNGMHLFDAHSTRKSRVLPRATALTFETVSSAPG
jgi:hypothetical protein